MTSDVNDFEKLSDKELNDTYYAVWAEKRRRLKREAIKQNQSKVGKCFKTSAGLNDVTFWKITHLDEYGECSCMSFAITSGARVRYLNVRFGEICLSQKVTPIRESTFNKHFEEMIQQLRKGVEVKS